jgi:hypothetical protein
MRLEEKQMLRRTERLMMMSRAKVGLSHPNATPADCFEHIQQMSDSQELANGLANVDEFQRAARGLGMNVSAHQGSQARAVHVCKLSQIEHDPI